MGISRVLFVLLFLLNAMITFGQDAYVRHTVQKGETIHSIAREYHISAAEIIRYNPDAGSKLRKGDIIIIPQQKEEIGENSTEITTHTVQPKETLYGLSKQYNCTVEELVALNPEVKNGLKVGMIIKVPKSKTQPEKQTVQQEDSTKYTYKTVEPKETVYSICKAADIKEDEFLQLNPEVRKQGLQIGMVVRLPKKMEVKEEVASDTNEKPYTLYRVKPGDDLVLIARKFNCTTDEILKLNPELISGVTPGRYIVVPTKKKTKPVEITKRAEYEMFWQLPTVYENPTVKLAAVLPLYLNVNDSLDSNRGLDVENAPVYSRSKLALQFLNGLQLALDTLVNLGYNVELSVFDTENDIERVRKIAAQMPNDVQFIIGPLYSKNAEEMARMLPNRTIFSPMSKSLKNEGKTNLIDGINHLNAEFAGIAETVNEMIDSTHFIFFNTDTIENRNAVAQVQRKLGAVDSSVFEFVWVDKEFSQLNHVSDYFSNDMQNVVVVIDQNPAFLSDLMRTLTKQKDTTLLVVGTSKIYEIKTLENKYLNQLNFVGLTTEHLNGADSTSQLFIQKFRALSNTEPNRFAYTGYDTGLYFSQIIGAYGSIPGLEDWPRWHGLIKGFDFRQEEGQGARNYYYYKTGITNFNLYQFD